MRLWSVHPRYLDRTGLLAVWREGLLAQAVLSGHTKGYRHHPQLVRFRACADPIGAIGTYLSAIVSEAENRKYAFDASKILSCSGVSIPVTEGQIRYERDWLLSKLEKRDEAFAEKLRMKDSPEIHPLFFCIPGLVEPWEKVS
jgi:hypothetical protein